MDKLLLIDGSSVLSRNFYGTLPWEYKNAKTQEEKELAMEKVMKSKDGRYTNAVFSMMKFLLKVIKEQQPTHMMIAWDISRDTFRRELYSDYKGNRGKTPEALKTQFVLMQEVLKSCGFFQGMLENFEADDIVGTFAKKFENSISIYIITGDQDSLQLVSDKTKVWLTTSKAEKLYEKRNIDIKTLNIPDKTFEFTPQTFEEEYGLKPLQIIDMKALEGDSSDNIPGVKGVGPTAVVPLLKEYGTVEGIYEAIENNSEDELKQFFKEDLGIKQSPISKLLKKTNQEIAEEVNQLFEQEINKKLTKEIINLLKSVDDKSFKEKVKKLNELGEDLFRTKTLELLEELKLINSGLVGKKAAFLSKELATIVTDIPEYINVSLDDLLININKEEMKKKFEELNFNSLLNK